MSAAVLKAAIKAEAEAWQEANRGWDKGMSASGLDKELNIGFIGMAPVANGPSGQEGYQYSESKSEGSDNALGFSPWADGWQSKLGKACPSADSGSSSEIMEWKAQYAPRKLAAKVDVDVDGCEVVGDWYRSDFSHAQLARRQAWAASYLKPSIEKNVSSQQPAFDFGFVAEVKMPKRVVMELAKGPKQLANVSWVSSDKKGLKGLIWSEKVRCKGKRRSPEKGARVMEARFGWKSNGSICVWADRELQGKFRPMSYGVNAEPVMDEAEDGSWEEFYSSVRGSVQSWMQSPLEALEQAESKEWREEKVQAIEAKMSQGQFQVLQLRSEGMRAKEIAQVVGCSPKRVEKLLEKGRARAKALWG